MPLRPDLGAGTLAGMPIRRPPRSPRTRASPCHPDRRRRLAALALAVALLGVGPASGAGPAAAAHTVEDTTLVGRWGWPLRPRPDLIHRFARPTQNWLPGHRGVDLGAAAGAAVLAVDDGVISHVGVIAGRGTVSVTHLTGLRSTYEPVEAVVTRGSAVTRGQQLGSLTMTGSHCAPQTCLHLGAIRGETYLDPMTLLLRPRIVLLPLRR